MNEAQFFKDLEIKAAKANVTLNFPKKSITKLDGYECYGYFWGEDDQTKGELVVVKEISKEKFFEVLVHESCHMDQWIENCDVWKNYNAECAEKISLWARGKIDLRKSESNKYMTDFIQMELDCEKRTIKKTKKYKLPIDTKKYIQKVNAFLLFYPAVVAKHKIKKSYSPDQEEEIVCNMSSRFYEDYSKVSKRVQKIFDSFYHLK